MSGQRSANEFSEKDYRYMSRALRLARKGIFSCHPNPRVGCVIASGDKILGEGWHEKAGEPHAEIMALRNAADSVKGATVYITLEPCSHHGRTPPCADALVEAGVSEVIVAMQDPNPQVSGSGMQKLSAAGIQVKCGLLRQQAEKLNRGFVSRMTRGRPWVTVKLGASLDGRTAMPSGESKWITSAAAREDVQRMRAASSAVLTGSGTVLADDPSLTVRLGGFDRQPLRVVMDSNLSIRDDARLLNDGFPLLLATTQNENQQRFIGLRDRGIDVRNFNAVAGKVDANDLLQCLSRDYSCNDVLVEAGPTICGGLLAGKLVDEIVFFMAPVIMGADARGMFSIPGLEKMADRVQLSMQDVRAIGRDWRITAVPLYHD